MARQKVSKWGFVGMGGLACVLFLDVGTAGIAPWWVTLLLVVFWLVMMRIGARWWVTHPGRVPWLAVVGVRRVVGRDRPRHQPARLGTLTRAQPRGCTRSTESRPSPFDVVTSTSPPGIWVTERSRPNRVRADGVSR